MIRSIVRGPSYAANFGERTAGRGGSLDRDIVVGTVERDAPIRQVQGRRGCGTQVGSAKNLEAVVSKPQRIVTNICRDHNVAGIGTAGKVGLPRTGPAATARQVSGFEVVRRAAVRRQVGRVQIDRRWGQQAVPMSGRDGQRGDVAKLGLEVPVAAQRRIAGVIDRCGDIGTGYASQHHRRLEAGAAGREVAAIDQDVAVLAQRPADRS